MPELPEIETTKRIIGPQITGRRIDETVIMRPEVIARPLADQFCKGTTGRMSAGTIAGFFDSAAGWNCVFPILAVLDGSGFQTGKTKENHQGVSPGTKRDRRQKQRVLSLLPKMLTLFPGKSV